MKLEISIKMVALAFTALIGSFYSKETFACAGGPPGTRCAPAPQPLDAKVKNALDIMAALDVPEIDPTPGIVGVTKREKRIGGLKCRKIMGFGPRGPRTDASCELRGRLNHKAIFDALLVPAVNVTPPGLAGYVIHQKNVGNLLCKSSAPVVPRAKASHSCELLHL